MTEAPYRLTEVRIRNVRCFESVSINLRESGDPRRWAVIFGDNGVGKTTLLRCIAMGMCDESSAAGLLRDIYGDWNRKLGDERLPATIEVKLHDGQNELEIKTEIVQQGSGYSRIKQRAYINGSEDNFPWGDIFACGYGAARRSFATRDVVEYATIDAVYTLFNYDQSLQNPELVVRRLLGKENGTGAKGAHPSPSEEVAPLLDSIASVLMLERGSITLTSAGLLISGPWGKYQPVGGMGDGYQATLSWITDFLGWAMLYDGAKALNNVSGIVLIDELEQHLHPRWQREIVKLLADQFPNVQFIATTHTPMCAVGTTELTDEECELIKLERDPDGVIAIENIPPPRGQYADQILTSLLFKLPTAGDNDNVHKIGQLNQLLTKPNRTEGDEKEIAALRFALEQRFGEAESEFETIIKKEVRAALARGRKASIDLIAADFEVLRLLRDLNSSAENQPS